MTGCIIFRKLLACSCLPFFCRFACVRAPFFHCLSSIRILPVHCNDEWCYFVCPVPCTFVVVFLLAFNNIHILLLPFFCCAARRLHWLCASVAHFSCVCVGLCVFWCECDILPLANTNNTYGTFIVSFPPRIQQCLICSTLSRASR